MLKQPNALSHRQERQNALNTITVDDEFFPLTVPSGRASGLKLKGAGVFTEKGGFLTSITLELNLNKALIVRGKKSVSYALKPVLQVASAELEPLPENTAGAVVLPDYESFMKLGDVFFLSIPADAVAEETILTVEEIKNYIEVLDPLTQQVIVQPDLASTFKLKPEGLVFATPLQLTLQYNIAALRDKFTEQDLTIRHDGHKVETTLDTYDQVVTGEINHFSSVTISTYSGKCTEEKVGKFNDGSPIKYFDCDKTWGYPRMHVAVVDKAALATTYELKVLAAHNSGETFRTQTVQHLVDKHFPDAVVAINGTTFNCKKGVGEACYDKNMDGSYPVYTTATDRKLNYLVTNPCVDGKTNNCTPEVALAFGGDNKDTIPTQYLTHNGKLLEKENKDKELYHYETVFKKSFGMTIGEVDTKDDRAIHGTAMTSMIGTHTGVRFGNLCRVNGDTGQGDLSWLYDTEASLFGYGEDKIIFLSSHYSPNPLDRPYCTFDTHEDMCEAVRLFGSTDAVSLDGGPSVQLVVDGKLKNIKNSSNARHVVNAVGLVCDPPEPDSDGKHTHIIHPTKYRCSNNLCWAPSWKPDMGLAEGDLNCWDADKWFEIKNGEICGDKVERDRSICEEVYAGDDSTITCESSDGTTQEGETCTGEDKEKDPGENIPTGQPDMDVQTSTLGNGQHTERHRRLTADPGESIYGFVKIRNKGTGNADDVNLSFYLDAGDIDFKREDKDFIAAHYVGKFFVGQEIRYVVGFHAPEKPGKYTFYGCIDNSGDSRYENNCPIMKNEDEYARLTVEEPPPEPSDLTAHSLRLNSGATTIPGGRPFGLTLTVANVGDGDAESNFQIRHEINGPSTSYTWKTLAESRFSTVPLYAGSSEEYSSFSGLTAAPTEEGYYWVRSCVDSGGVIAESNEANNCTEAFEIEVLPSLDPTLKPVYRFYSEANLAHFFTIFESEKDTVINTYPTEVWRYERIGFCAHTSQVDDSLPVYRFYSDSNTAHFFTIFETEKNNIISTYPEDIWRYERIGWYAYNYPKAGTIPVYRFYSESNRAHFYTVFESEKQYIEEHYPDDVWRYERIGWWVYPCP